MKRNLLLICTFFLLLSTSFGDCPQGTTYWRDVSRGSCAFWQPCMDDFQECISENVLGHFIYKEDCGAGTGWACNYEVCNETCSDVCWQEGCTTRVDARCTWNTSFTACEPCENSEVVTSVFLCTSDIIQGGTCYSCYKAENWYLGRYYYKCGSSTSNLYFAQRTELNDISSITQISIQDDTFFGRYQGYDVISNPICGSMWRQKMEDIGYEVILYYEPFYSGWIVDPREEGEKKTIAHEEVSYTADGYTFYRTEPVEMYDRGLRYDRSRYAMLEVSCGAGISEVPIPLFIPGCRWWSKTGPFTSQEQSLEESYAVGAFKVCPIGKDRCSGYEVNSYGGESVFLKYYDLIRLTDTGFSDCDLINAETCPCLEGELASDECQGELDLRVKSLCFYDERVENGVYYPPLFTDVVKKGGKELCVCDASQSGDYTKDCGRYGVCVEKDQGRFVNDVECSRDGWIGNYTEVELVDFYVFNELGEFHRYTLLPKVNRDTWTVRKDPTKKPLLFASDDYISFAIRVRNVGSNNITKPILIFAKADAGFVDARDNSLLNNLLEKQGVYDLKFDDDGEIVMVRLFEPDGNVVQDTSMGSFLGGKYWGFWLSDVRTSNVEWVYESKEWDGKIEVGEEAIFVLSLPARLTRNQKSVKILFYDEEAKLRHAKDLSTLDVNDYLANLTLKKTSLDLLYSFLDSKLQNFMAYAQDNSLRVQGDIGLDNGITCQDCLGCVASTLDSDSFFYFWMGNGKKNATWDFANDVKRVNRFAGAFFIPRAYLMGMSVDLTEKYPKVETEINATQSFKVAAYLANDEQEAKKFYDYFNSPSPIEMVREGRSELYNYSLYLLGATPFTFRALAGATSQESYEGFVVRIYALDGSLITEGKLNENDTFCFGMFSSGQRFNVSLYDAEGNLLFGRLPSVVNESHPPMDIDQYVANLTSDVNPFLTNNFTFEMVRDSQACVWIQEAPVQIPLAGYEVYFINQEKILKGVTGSEGEVTIAYSEKRLPHTLVVLLDQEHDFLAGVKLKDNYRLELTDDGNGDGDDEIEVELRIGGEPAGGYTITFYNASDGYEIESEVTDSQGKATFQDVVGFQVFGRPIWVVIEVKELEENLTATLNVSGAHKFVTPNLMWSVNATYLNGYSEFKEIKFKSQGVGNVPVNVSLISETDCEKFLLLEKLEGEPYVREVPYEVSRIGGKCEFEFVLDRSQDRSVLFYYGDLAPILEYDKEWGRVDDQDLVLLGDATNVSYSLDCNKKTGPCIVGFGQYEMTCDPDSLIYSKSCDLDQEDWVSGGMFWDRNEIESTPEVGYYDGPVKKCLTFSYGDVNRTSCIYRGVPGVFERVEVENLTMPFANDMNHNLASRLWLGSWISSTTYLRSSKESDYEIFGNSKYLTIADDLGRKEYVYEFDPGTVRTDAFVSDLYISQIYGTSNEKISYPDSSLILENYENLDFDTLKSSAKDFNSEYGGTFVSDGSLNYYARRWIDSGTSRNCDDLTDLGEDRVFGTTCGYAPTSFFFGIMRVGIHEVKFNTIEEGQVDGQDPDVFFLNEIGESAREVEPVLCDVENGKISDCLIDRDEWGNELLVGKEHNTTRGYVVVCMFYYNNWTYEGSDVAMYYFKPYIHPLSWNVSFDIVVSPQTYQYVPSKFEEKYNALMLSFRGDGICQPLVGEGCLTAPEDCICRVIENQVHTLPVCLVNNTCGFSCESGWGNCDGDWMNGCGSDLVSGHSVYDDSSPFWTSNTTHGGMCYCQEGWGDCDLNLAQEGSNGCETDLLNDINNCGACGSACYDLTNLHGTQACVNGECRYSCDEGWANCDGDWSNGCEVDLMSDVYNCGSCGNDCTRPHTISQCVNGQCSFECEVGWGNCDGDWSNGCEVDLSNHLNADCTCEDGWADCNNDLSDGCEVNVLEDENNCGSCGNACAPGEFCINGVCGTCVSDADCDDNNPCTQDRCENYKCTYRPLSDTSCSVCTDGELLSGTCQSGTCVYDTWTECLYGCNEEGTDCKTGYYCTSNTCGDEGWPCPPCTSPEGCFSPDNFQTPYCEYGYDWSLCLLTGKCYSSCELSESCKYGASGVYCYSDSDCDDGDPCTVDSCNSEHKCVYTTVDCDQYDGYYCASGNVREYRDYYCDGEGGCDYDVTSSFDCDLKDGWYCTGNEAEAEYRDYYCSSGQCKYTVTRTSSCYDTCCRNYCVDYCADRGKMLLDYECLGGDCTCYCKPLHISPT